MRRIGAHAGLRSQKEESTMTQSRVIGWTLFGAALAALLAAAPAAHAYCSYNIPPCTITINGTFGNDTLNGSAASECMYGSIGNDTLNGAGGDDYLLGDSGDDSLDGGNGNDLLDGWTGNDFMLGDSDNDQLFGYDGNDSILGNAGSDNLCGEYGDDELFGGNNGSNNDYVDGGPNGMLGDKCQEGETTVSCERS